MGLDLDLESISEATSGAVGSLVSTTLLYPLDTCKTRYQAEVRGNDRAKYRNLSDVFWEAISTRQVLSLYQGLETKNLQSFISQFIYFYGYSYFKRLYVETSGVKSIGTRANLVLAAAAGACTAIVTQPLDTASSRMQTSAFGKSKGLWKTLTEGSWIDAFDGLGISLLLTANPAIQYTVFDQLKLRLLKRKNKTGKDSSPEALSAFTAFVLGAVSKTVATVLTYPAIRCKVMIQAADEDDGKTKNPQPKSSKTIPAVLCAIWKREGILGFFKGLHAQILKTVLSSALLLMIKEKISAATWVLLLSIRRSLLLTRGRLKKWDAAFRSMFGAPKTGGTRCSTERILGEFSFCLTPWNDSFHMKHKIITSPSPSSSSLFPSEGIFAPSPFRPVLSCPIPFHPIPKKKKKKQREGKMMSGNYTTIDNQNVSGSVPAAVPDPGHLTVKFQDSTLQTFPPSETRGKIARGALPPSDADDTFSKPVSGSDEPQQGGWLRIFSVASYKQYFDVDTSDVLERIKDSLLPFSGTFNEKTSNSPDLYGPFWICTTLIFVAAAIGTFVTYVAHKMKSKDWEYDINVVQWSAGLFYGYVTIVPLVLYVILKYFSAPSGLVQLFCLYGYSLFVFIPALCLSVVPLEIFRWVIAGVAGVMSATFVAVNLRAHIVSAGERWFLIVAGIFLLQLALSVVLKLYLFTVTV
ncbi:hypothetical protein DVH24_015211 [Malus domestica]|uniref:Yip1 domain-containing protein n=2 Tax=Malus domestica TaxID=3750 RepID=A0A498K8Z3_MALDO|nr:hypothetical protein DVH24_015211 [Malus domestica]